jgi:hypothetical protein
VIESISRTDLDEIAKIHYRLAEKLDNVKIYLIFKLRQKHEENTANEFDFFRYYAKKEKMKPEKKKRILKKVLNAVKAFLRLQRNESLFKEKFKALDLIKEFRVIYYLIF